MPPIKGRKRGPYKKKFKKNYKGKRRFTYDKMKPYNMRFTRWSTLESTYNVHLAITGSAAGNNIGSTVFKLSDTSGYGELKNLFDNYCIRKVLYRWVLTRNPDQATTASKAGIYPRLTWVHDFNDSTAITRLQMQQHPRMREVFFNDNYQRTKWYSLRPASLTQLFESGLGAVAYKPTWGAFVDTNDVDMPHYGIKYTYMDLYEGMGLYLEAKIVIDCKGIS